MNKTITTLLAFVLIFAATESFASSKKKTPKRSKPTVTKVNKQKKQMKMPKKKPAKNLDEAAEDLDS